MEVFDKFRKERPGRLLQNYGKLYESQKKTYQRKSSKKVSSILIKQTWSF